MKKNCEDYLNNLQFLEKRSEKTIKAYKSDISQFLLYLNESEIDFHIVTKDDLMSFFEQLKDSGVGPRSLARKISCLKSFANFLIESGIYTEKQLFYILNLHHPRFEKFLPKVASFEVILKVIEFIKNDESFYKKDWEKLRDISLIVMLYTSGMRVFEALSITKKQFLSHQGFVNIIGKGRKERIIPILPICDEYIGKYLSLCEFSRDYLFISSSGLDFPARIFQKNLEYIRRALGIGEFLTPHCFRHSCATSLLDNNAQIRKIQELLGHSSLRTTQNYTHVSNQKMMFDYDKIMNS